jgi:hypothetical protein
VRDRTSGIATVTCNGLAASVAGATFFCDLTLSDGDNTIVAQATDLAGNVGTARIRVTLGTNQAPVANAGKDFHAETGRPVMLDGSASFDPDRDMLTFSWHLLRVPPGSAVTDASLMGAMTAAPRFTPDVSGDYEVELEVSDGTLSDTDTVVVTATPPNVPPHANASMDHMILVCIIMILNGADSNDPDHGPAPLSFQWSFAEVPAGSRLTNADISGARTALASFRSDSAGTYRVLLVVSDGAATDQDEVHVQALPPNVPPNADAGPDVMILLGQVATLDGTGSNDPDNGPGSLVLQWTFVDVPSGSSLTDTALQGAHTPTPCFTPDVPGVYLLRLDVSDGVASAHDQAMVAANDVPVATNDAFTVAQDTTLTVPAPGVLANDTDVVGNPLTATLGSSVSHGTLTLNTNGAFTYTPSAGFRGSDSFTYRANDGFVDSNVATVTITVQPSACPPPTITSVTPTSGPIGTEVTITGSNFIAAPACGTGPPQVAINKLGGGTMAAPVARFDATSVAIVVPAGAASGPLTVTVAGQSATSTQVLTIVPASTFTLTAAPNTADVIQGQSVSYVVRLQSTNRFVQLASLTMAGLPAGVTASLTPSRITAGQTALLTLTAASTMPPTAGIPFTVSAAATVDGITLRQAVGLRLNVAPVTTAFVGRTVVADTLQTGLAGVTVTFLGRDGNGRPTGCTGQTISDAAGNFMLTNLSPACTGEQLVRYNGLTTTAPAGQYAGVDLLYTFVAGQVTRSPVLLHLPRIDDKETVLVQQNAPVDQTFHFQTIPGLSVTVYAGTTLTLVDGTQPNPFPFTPSKCPWTACRMPSRPTRRCSWSSSWRFNRPMPRPASPWR